MTEPIIVWRYHDAPANLQISTNGGDEDWLAEVPPELKDDYIPWLESSAFGCCEIEVVPHPAKEGWMIHIGSHA